MIHFDLKNLCINYIIYIMDLEKIPDYLTLYSADAKIKTDSTITWEIPPLYYSNQRSTVCYLSLCDAILSSNHKDDVIINYMNGAQNQHTTKNNGAYLGKYNYYDNGNYVYGSSSQPKLLISARPTTITIQFNDVEGDKLVGFTIDCILVLKFEYFNQEDTAKSYTSTFTQNLL